MENSGQPLRYLTFEDILIVAQRHVDNYQLLKENQLRYLVQMVGERLGDTELFPTLTIKAAFYAHHIITGHIFLDGNKRIGLDCALWFLTMNGCSLRRDINDSIIELGLGIADGTTTELETIARHIQSWIL